MKNNNIHITKYNTKHWSKYIACFNEYHISDNNPVNLHPEGHFEIIFQLNNHILNNTTTTNGWKKRPNSFIGGLHTKSYFVQSENKNTRLLGIQFKPNSAKHFLPDKLNLFKNGIIDLQDIFSAQKLEQLNYLSNKEKIDDNIKNLDAFLRSIFIEKSKSVIDFALEMMINKNGFVHIKDMADTTRLSVAQFRKRFNEEIGLSPKEYCKVIRINLILDILSKNSNLKLTQLAYELGYFDQSHFIKDFKSVTGCSPKNFKLHP